MTEQSNEKRINPNFASLEQLQGLTGVGPNLAERIQRGRPYQEAEDLLMVSGVGRGSLERWADRLTFEGDYEEDPEGPTPPEESVEAAPIVVQPQKGARPSKVSRSSDTLVWVAIAVILSVFLSVSLTLGVLLSINGTLNTGRHASVRAAESELAELQADMSELRSQLEGIDQRLDALEGLTSRMVEVEGQVDELESQMESALTSVETMRERFDGLEEVTQSLNSRVNRFDMFLDGLRDLLHQADPDSSSEQDQEGAPSQ